jgi:type IV secretory pathway TrbD component
MLTTWIIGLAGLLIFVIALSCWINLLRHDRKSN